LTATMTDAPEEGWGYSGAPAGKNLVVLAISYSTLLRVGFSFARRASLFSLGAQG
jgi:hypothetical protein